MMIIHYAEKLSHDNKIGATKNLLITISNFVEDDGYVLGTRCLLIF